MYPLDINADFEIGNTSASNDFEIIVSEFAGKGIYVPGTEFGGIIEHSNDKSMSNSRTLKGWTWRGLLTQWFIEPDSGNDYKIVSGEANTVIRELLSKVLGGFFYIPDTDSGLTIDDYQFKLHVSVLEGLMDMLSTYEYKLCIYAKRTAPGEPIKVFLEAKPAVKIMGTYDEDTGLGLTFTDNQMGVNHLICWGKGELKNRQRIDLYINEKGKVSDKQYFTGFQERQAVFDYGNAESLADLRKQGIKRLKEIASSKKLQIDEVGEVDLEIGDIVAGRKNDIGLVIERPIISKILRVSGRTESIEYKVKGEG